MHFCDRDSGSRVAAGNHRPRTASDRHDLTVLKRTFPDCINMVIPGHGAQWRLVYERTKCYLSIPI
jgi:hypothetical protein